MNEHWQKEKETIAKIRQITQEIDGIGFDSQTEAREELRDALEEAMPKTFRFLTAGILPASRAPIWPSGGRGHEACSTCDGCDRPA